MSGETGRGGPVALSFPSSSTSHFPSPVKDDRYFTTHPYRNGAPHNTTSLSLADEPPPHHSRLKHRGHRDGGSQPPPHPTTSPSLDIPYPLASTSSGHLNVLDTIDHERRLKEQQMSRSGMGVSSPPPDPSHDAKQNPRHTTTTAASSSGGRHVTGRSSGGSSSSRRGGSSRRRKSPDTPTPGAYSDILEAAATSSSSSARRSPHFPDDGGAVGSEDRTSPTDGARPSFNPRLFLYHETIKEPSRIGTSSSRRPNTNRLSPRASPPRTARQAGGSRPSAGHPCFPDPAGEGDASRNLDSLGTRPRRGVEAIPSGGSGRSSEPSSSTRRRRPNSGERESPNSLLREGNNSTSSSGFMCGQGGGVMQNSASGSSLVYQKKTWTSSNDLSHEERASPEAAVGHSTLYPPAHSLDWPTINPIRSGSGGSRSGSSRTRHKTPTSHPSVPPSAGNHPALSFPSQAPHGYYTGSQPPLLGSGGARETDYYLETSDVYRRVVPTQTGVAMPPPHPGPGRVKTYCHPTTRHEINTLTFTSSGSFTSTTTNNTADQRPPLVSGESSENGIPVSNGEYAGEPQPPHFGAPRLPGNAAPQTSSRDHGIRGDPPLARDVSSHKSDPSHHSSPHRPHSSGPHHLDHRPYISVERVETSNCGADGRPPRPAAPLSPPTNGRYRSPLRSPSRHSDQQQYVGAGSSVETPERVIPHRKSKSSKALAKGGSTLSASTSTSFSSTSSTRPFISPIVSVGTSPYSLRNGTENGGGPQPPVNDTHLYSALAPPTGVRGSVHRSLTPPHPSSSEVARVEGWRGRELRLRDSMEEEMVFQTRAGSSLTGAEPTVAEEGHACRPLHSGSRPNTEKSLKSSGGSASRHPRHPRHSREEKAVGRPLLAATVPVHSQLQATQSHLEEVLQFLEQENDEDTARKLETLAELPRVLEGDIQAAQPGAHALPPYAQAPTRSPSPQAQSPYPGSRHTSVSPMQAKSYDLRRPGSVGSSCSSRSAGQLHGPSASKSRSRSGEEVMEDLLHPYRQCRPPAAAPLGPCSRREVTPLEGVAPSLPFSGEDDRHPCAGEDMRGSRSSGRRSLESSREECSAPHRRVSGLGKPDMGMQYVAGGPCAAGGPAYPQTCAPPPPPSHGLRPQQYRGDSASVSPHDSTPRHSRHASNDVPLSPVPPQAAESERFWSYPRAESKLPPSSLDGAGGGKGGGASPGLFPANDPNEIGAADPWRRKKTAKRTALLEEQRRRNRRREKSSPYHHRDYTNEDATLPTGPPRPSTCSPVLYDDLKETQHTAWEEEREANPRDTSASPSRPYTHPRPHHSSSQPSEYTNETFPDVPSMNMMPLGHPSHPTQALHAAVPSTARLPGASAHALPVGERQSRGSRPTSASLVGRSSSSSGQRGGHRSAAALLGNGVDPAGQHLLPILRTFTTLLTVSTSETPEEDETKRCQLMASLLSEIQRESLVSTAPQPSSVPRSSLRSPSDRAATPSEDCVPATASRTTRFPASGPFELHPAPRRDRPPGGAYPVQPFEDFGEASRLPRPPAGGNQPMNGHTTESGAAPPSRGSLPRPATGGSGTVSSSARRGPTAAPPSGRRMGQRLTGSHSSSSSELESSAPPLGMGSTSVSRLEEPLEEFNEDDEDLVVRRAPPVWTAAAAVMPPSVVKEVRPAEEPRSPDPSPPRNEATVGLTSPSSPIYSKDKPTGKNHRAGGSSPTNVAEADGGLQPVAMRTTSVTTRGASLCPAQKEGSPGGLSSTHTNGGVTSSSSSSAGAPYATHAKDPTLQSVLAALFPFTPAAPPLREAGKEVNVSPEACSSTSTIDPSVRPSRGRNPQPENSSATSLRLPETPRALAGKTNASRPNSASLLAAAASLSPPPQPQQWQQLAYEAEISGLRKELEAFRAAAEEVERGQSRRLRTPSPVRRDEQGGGRRMSSFGAEVDVDEAVLADPTLYVETMDKMRETLVSQEREVMELQELLVEERRATSALRRADTAGGVDTHHHHRAAVVPPPPVQTSATTRADVPQEPEQRRASSSLFPGKHLKSLRESRTPRPSSQRHPEAAAGEQDPTPPPAANREEGEGSPPLPAFASPRHASISPSPRQPVAGSEGSTASSLAAFSSSVSPPVLPPAAGSRSHHNAVGRTSLPASPPTSPSPSPRFPRTPAGLSLGAALRSTGATSAAPASSSRQPRSMASPSPLPIQTRVRGRNVSDSVERAEVQRLLEEVLPVQTKGNAEDERVAVATVAVECEEALPSRTRTTARSSEGIRVEPGDSDGASHAAIPFSVLSPVSQRSSSSSRHHSGRATLTQRVPPATTAVRTSSAATGPHQSHFPPKASKLSRPSGREDSRSMSSGASTMSRPVYRSSPRSVVRGSVAAVEEVDVDSKPPMKSASAHHRTPSLSSARASPTTTPAPAMTRTSSSGTPRETRLDASTASGTTLQEARQFSASSKAPTMETEVMDDTRSTSLNSKNTEERLIVGHEGVSPSLPQLGAAEPRQREMVRGGLLSSPSQPSSRPRRLSSGNLWDHVPHKTAEEREQAKKMMDLYYTLRRAVEEEQA